MILLFLKTGAERLASLSPRFLKVMSAWNRHQAVKKLNSFDDHLLEDIGVTRADIKKIVNGPSIKTVSHSNTPLPYFSSFLSKKIG